MDQETRDTSGASRAGWEMPIIDTKGVIVGWTTKAPNNVGGLTHHPEAERLLAGPVAAAYVGLKKTADAIRAGAPLGWRGP